MGGHRLALRRGGHSQFLTHHNGVRHSGLEGKIVETKRGPLNVTAGALQYLLKEGNTLVGDPGTLEELTRSFSLYEIKKLGP